MVVKKHKNEGSQWKSLLVFQGMSGEGYIQTSKQSNLERDHGCKNVHASRMSQGSFAWKASRELNFFQRKNDVFSCEAIVISSKVKGKNLILVI